MREQSPDSHFGYTSRLRPTYNTVYFKGRGRTGVKAEVRIVKDVEGLANAKKGFDITVGVSLSPEMGGSLLFVIYRYEGGVSSMKAVV